MGHKSGIQAFNSGCNFSSCLLEATEDDTLEKEVAREIMVDAAVRSVGVMLS